MENISFDTFVHNLKFHLPEPSMLQAQERLRQLCLELDPFREDDRLKLIEELKSWGQDWQGLDPFALSNRLLVLLDSIEQLTQK